MGFGGRAAGHLLPRLVTAILSLVGDSKSSLVRDSTFFPVFRPLSLEGDSMGFVGARVSMDGYCLLGSADFEFGGSEWALLVLWSHFFWQVIQNHLFLKKGLTSGGFSVIILPVRERT